MKRVVVALIYLYKQVLSPYLGRSCRYEPTCSQYALGCYQNHNFIKASWFTVWRILRCNPFAKGGNDPVPINLKK